MSPIRIWLAWRGKGLLFPGFCLKAYRSRIVRREAGGERVSQHAIQQNSVGPVQDEAGSWLTDDARRAVTRRAVALFLAGLLQIKSSRSLFLPQPALVVIMLPLLSGIYLYLP